MNQLLIVFVLGIVVGGIVFWYKGKNTRPEASRKPWCAVPEGIDPEDEEESETSGDQILALLDTQAKVTNNDVEALLGVSDSTATRYLQELEDEGKIKQIGTVGRSVHYIRHED